MTYPFRDHPPHVVASPYREPVIQRIPDEPVFAEVVTERAQQDAKWGQQNHPDVHQAVTADPHLLHVIHPIPSARKAKRTTDSRAHNGFVSWADIAIEELAEALEAFAEGDEEAGRTEVVQLVAVGVQWLQAIDRRRAGRLAAIREEQSHAAMLGRAHLPGPQL